MKKLLAIILAMVLVFGLIGCSTPATEPTDTTETQPTTETEAQTSYKIGISVMEMTAYTWYQGAIDGAKQWAEDNGVEIEFLVEDSRSDVQTMLTNIENMVAAGCDGIILFPADASSAIPLMKTYTEQGVPFVIGDYKQEPASEDDVVWETFVGHDMKALGQTSGALAVEYLETLGKDDPTCLFITRPQDGQSAVDRHAGFAEVVLEAFPNATIIEEGDTGAGNRDSSQTLTENVLQRETTIDVVSGHNDAAVVGAYNAAVAQGRDAEMKFIGIAGDIDILTWLEEGNEAWLGEILQDPVVLGYTSAEALMSVLMDGAELPAEYDLPSPEAITKENVSEYDWKNWSWLG